METKELRTKSAEELTKLLSEQRSALRQLKFDLAAGRVKNIRDLHTTKTTIARIETVLVEQERARYAGETQDA
jgi:ribosomal protein L29